MTEQTSPKSIIYFSMRFWLPGGSHNLLHMRLVISIVKCCPNLQRSYNVLHSPPNFPNMSTFLLHNSNPFSIVTLQITSTHNTTSRPSSLHPGGIAVLFTSWYIAIVSNLQKKKSEEPKVLSPVQYISRQDVVTAYQGRWAWRQAWGRPWLSLVLNSE